MVAISGTITLWKYRRIPYEFEAGYPCSGDVRAAMDKWEKAAGVSFVTHRNEENYLVIRDPASQSSSSMVGMQAGAQNVYIEVGYKSLHELGHALGLIHEQIRSDRDQYVDVQWQNIVNGKSNSQFQVQSDSQNLTDYDPASVMHYPAPAKGWQGDPHDQEVWTMRWKADRDKTLGPESWSELSTLDKSIQGLYAKYLTIPVPMGAETANGSWNNPYAVQFPFSIGGRQFFYGQNLSGKNWFIQELLADGKMGSETDHGSWGYSYGVQFPFTIGGRVFFYGQNLDAKNWFIQELLSGGKMGNETDHGSWGYSYGVQFPFTIGDRVFFYGQNLDAKNWFIQELLSRGKMGDETDHGSWNFAYGVQFPFTIGGRVFFYGQNLVGKKWFIQELLSGGKMGQETDHGDWGNAYRVQFPYAIGSNHYFYGQNQDTNYWFIQRLQEGGKVGDELQGGFWQEPYGVQFPFAIGGSQYFYGQKITWFSGYNWFIQQLLIDVWWRNNIIVRRPPQKNQKVVFYQPQLHHNPQM
ncbi:hatching enzyme [Elaphomyces granulatus]